jgi:uncharacterized protein (TIGR02996 family)
MTFVPDADWYQGIAPDNRSARAGRQVAEVGRLSLLRRTADGSYFAARCAASDGDHYSVRVDLGHPQRPIAECDCSSLKSPCKHALGLLWLWLTNPQGFEEVPLPARVARTRTAPETTPPETRRQDRTTLGEEFLRSIREEPTDDVCRLIYSDWLEENGTDAEVARARFIRLQIERTHLPADDPRQAMLEKEERRLWTKNRKAWMADLPYSLRRRDVVFHRGFLEELHLSIRQLLQYGDDLMAHFPLHRLRLAPAPIESEAAQLAVWPGLRRLRTLDLSRLGLGSARSLRELLDTPFLRPLEELDLSDNRFTYQAIEVLTSLAHFEHLHSLYLAGNPLGPQSARFLADPQRLPALRNLDVRGTGLAERSNLVTLLRSRFGDRLLVEAKRGLNESV